ncbi:MAG UNVERIFIED_CONTAM: hypothetical protein LVT10_15015 [Anaerolineae bacterium]|jgi:hypothetical protein
MADFTYEAEGLVTAKRCGNNVGVSSKRMVVIQFSEGDRAWIRYEAERGRIRSVWIKRLKITQSAATYGRVVVLYFDNLNAAFNEEDLITNSDAVRIALDYHQRRLYEAQKAIECL